MFAFIRGSILCVQENFLIVVTGDIGYKIFSSEALLRSAKVDDTIAVYLSHIVREDASDLYGFETFEEVAFFERLLSIAGVGPKTALSALSTTSLEKLKRSIASGDAELLRKVSGIGAKTAARIIAELQHDAALTNGMREGSFHEDSHVIDALVALGYTLSDARDVVASTPDTIQGISARVTHALKLLSTGR